MWLNKEKTSADAIAHYQKQLLQACPEYIVIDDLFNHSLLTEIAAALQQPDNWQSQRHTYAELYVNDDQWNSTKVQDRFVQRDVFAYTDHHNAHVSSIAVALLTFLRGPEFIAFLSRIFKVEITDINVEDPAVNTNYFRLSTKDFVAQHADDSPGRKICLLLYLNQQWDEDKGGELVFLGKECFGQSNQHKTVEIAPLFNRCVMFNPSSKGSEHWVKALNTHYPDQYRYNITSWYWSE